MRKYFTHDGADQKGPFTIDELRKMTLSDSTSIWTEGWESWKTVDKVDELSDVFNKNTPPPFISSRKSDRLIQNDLPKHKTSGAKSTISKNSKILLFVVLVVALFVGGVALYSMMSKKSESSTVAPGSYEEKVMSVEEIEKSNPVNYLKAGGTYRKTLILDRFKIDGTITNNATVANYKDAKIKITFFSGTDTELKRESFIIYDLFPSHSTKSFELKVDRPSGAEKINWIVVGATPN